MVKLSHSYYYYQLLAIVINKSINRLIERLNTVLLLVSGKEPHIVFVGDRGFLGVDFDK